MDWKRFLIFLIFITPLYVVILRFFTQGFNYWIAILLYLLIALSVVTIFTNIIERYKVHRGYDKFEKLNHETVKRSRYIPKAVKIAVWQRDGGKCVNCGSRENLQFDHIIPFSLGGANTVDNIQILCQKCNEHKSNHIGI